MKQYTQRRSFISLSNIVITLLVAGIYMSGAGRAETPDLRSFGAYKAAETSKYNRYHRDSVYVPVRDGVKLAVDIFRPMTKEGIEDTPLPVIFYYARYWRGHVLPNGSILTNLGVLPEGESEGALVSRDSSGRLIFWDTGRESIPEIMRNGYIFIRAEGRGTGASEGVRHADYTKQEARDGADIINWIAQQPWSSGKVGMIGGSYPGIMQLKVAAEKPPALKAIFPAAPAFDYFRLGTAGTGILHKGIIGYRISQARKDGLVKADEVVSQLLPVDADPRRKHLAEIINNRMEKTPPGVVVNAFRAIAPQFADTVERLGKAWGTSSLRETLSTILDTNAFLNAMRGKSELQKMAMREFSVYRDAEQFSDKKTTGRSSAHLILDDLNKSGIPVYIWTGWYDMDTVGALTLFHNLATPKKVTVGPWSHGPNEDNGRPDSPLDAIEAQARELLTAEALRWFDYWLKGIDTGVMKDAPVHYGHQSERTKIVWETSQTWPISTSNQKAFFLSAGPSGTIGSAYDGLLTDSSAKKENSAPFTVDYTASMGTQTRYHDAFSGVPFMAYPDLTQHARTAMTFTTKALEKDLLVTGHPVVHVIAESTAPDGDLFFYLEDVSDETVQYVSEGVIRASHRVQGKPPYDKMGLPYSDSRAKIVAATPPFNKGEVELKLDMQPTSYLFKAGHRIRLVVTGADADNYITPPLLPPPTIKIRVGGKSPSRISLPVTPKN